MRVEEALEELREGSLKSFVARRKALASGVRSAGDKEGARRVAGMAKPALAAWVINQLVRAHPDVVDAAVAAIDRQRDLQLGALSGKLDVEALNGAKQEEKDAMRRVTVRASELLEEDGHAASKTNLDRVVKLLRDAALNPDARPLLDDGTLERDVGDASLEAVASQLDPAMLLAALTAKKRTPNKKPRKVDGMFARSARSDATNGTVRSPREVAPSPKIAPAREKASTPPTPTAAERKAAKERDRVERLAATKVEAATLRNDIVAQREQMTAASQREASLESELEAARAHARSARRALGDLKVKLEQAEKRIRLLDDS